MHAATKTIALLGCLAGLSFLGGCAEPEPGDPVTNVDDLRAALGVAEFAYQDASVRVVASTFGHDLRFDAVVERAGFRTVNATCVLGSREGGASTLSCGENGVSTFEIELAPTGEANIRLGANVGLTSNATSLPVPALGINDKTPRPLVITATQGIHPAAVSTLIRDAIGQAGAMPTTGGTAAVESWVLLGANLGLTVRLDPSSSAPRLRASCYSSARSPLLWATRERGAARDLAPASTLAARISESTTWMLESCTLR